MVEKYNGIRDMMRMIVWTDNKRDRIGSKVVYKGKQYTVKDVFLKTVIDGNTYQTTVKLNPELYIVGVVDTNDAYFVKVFTTVKSIKNYLKDATYKIATMDNY